MSDDIQPPDLDVDIPRPSGLRVTTDLPYHILLVSDFAGSDGGAVAGPLPDGAVDVNADNFDEIMAAAAPSVRLKTTDPLLPGNVMVELDLRFDSLRAFDPAALTDRIPTAAALSAVREKLVERMRGRLSADELADAARQTAAQNAALTWLPDSLAWSPSGKADAPAVDSVLEQLDLGGEDTGEAASPPPKSPLGKVVAAAAGSGSAIPAGEASAIRRTLAEIDRQIGTWLTAVLHAPPVQAIESAWRGLAFLVSNIDFRKGIMLSALHAPRGELTERLVSRIIDPVFDEGMDAPALIAVDAAFSSTAADMEALDELAQHAASLPAVLVTGVAPGFFGVKQAWQVPTLPPLISLLDQYQFARWRTLRSQPYARALGVVFGRGLLRGLHRRDDVPDLAYAYREECVTDADLVWATGAVTAAATVARSIADTGWPTAMAGHLHGRLPGFATAQGGKSGDKKFGPSDTLMPQPKIEELAVVGVNAALGQRDHDDVILWNGLTAAQLHGADHTALLEVSLPYQLFATRLSTLLLALKPHLSPSNAEGAAALVTTHLCDWLGFKEQPGPDQLCVQVEPLEGPGSPLQLAVRVTPPPNILPGGVPVVLGYKL